MIKPPFIARSGESGFWIEDAAGLTIWNLNSLIEIGEEQLFELTELFARGANERLRILDHVVNMARSPKVGRPRSKKPSPLALAQRKSRAKRKQSKPE